MSFWLPMAGFALAASITPGPVNIVALGSGARHGFVPSLRHVTGATLGFTLLLLLVGLGLRELMAQWPAAVRALRWLGVGFLLWMAWRLARDDGRLDAAVAPRGPSLATGAAMQWLNPKAWLAALAGMAAFCADGEPRLVWQFAAIYFLVCYASVACWAAAGSVLRASLRDARRVRRFNRAMAALLAISALGLLA